MLQVTIPSFEEFDSSNNTFITVDGQTLTLEHSLVSISKWESKWNKPFISKEQKTPEESRDYIKCMTLTQNVNPEIYENIPPNIYRIIDEYIDAPMTATTFTQRKGSSQNREIITSEVIYYMMIALGIPFECQKWHLNRLLTLIRVCDIKNNPSKKMSKNEVLNRNASLNAARKAAMHTRG